MKYIGSKNRISKYLVPIIQEAIDKYNVKNYVEPFVGGANMIDKIKCENKIGFDNQKYLIALLNKVKTGINDIPTTITKEQYALVYNSIQQKTGDFPDWYIGLVGFCASYNGKWFGGYANGVKTKVGITRNYTDESIKNLKKQAMELNFKNCNFYLSDFREIKDIKNAVIYCDPPYKDTTKYSSGNFPYEDFYNWVRNMAKNNIVFISEYSMPSDFLCIWKLPVSTHLNHAKKLTKMEKLFACGDVRP